MTDELDANSIEIVNFPSGTKSKSCGCGKANKATITAASIQDKSAISYHCHPNNCQLQCVVCLKVSGSITEKSPLPTGKDIYFESESGWFNLFLDVAFSKKPLTVRGPTHQDPTPSKSGCSSSHKENSKSSPDKNKTTVKTQHNNENIKTSFNNSQDSKFLPGNLTAIPQTINQDAISKKSSKSYCSSCNNVKSRRISLNSNHKDETTCITSFSEGSRTTPENVETYSTSLTVSENSKSLLPGNVDITPQPETSKVCYCKSCQTKPDQPCAPGQCTTMVDKAQLARVTQPLPDAKSSPKVHVSTQTTKSEKTTKRSKSSCCKWLKSTFRPLRSSGTTPASKLTSKAAPQNNECLCAPKGCCIPELCHKNSGFLVNIQ